MCKAFFWFVFLNVFHIPKMHSSDGRDTGPRQAGGNTCIWAPKIIKCQECVSQSTLGLTGALGCMKIKNNFQLKKKKKRSFSAQTILGSPDRVRQKLVH